jgi:LmbE family N-acetylglucosaminyl deacetylase
VAEIRSDIERYRPQVTLTFHRRGVSGHPDHIAVAGFLDDAIRTAGDRAPQASYEWGIPVHKAALYQRPSLAPLADDEIAAVVPIDDAAMERKIDAIRRHETQVAFFESLLAMFDYRAMARPEYFARARVFASAPTDKPVTDLFDGIEVA